MPLTRPSFLLTSAYPAHSCAQTAPHLPSSPSPLPESLRSPPPQGGASHGAVCWGSLGQCRCGAAVLLPPPNARSTLLPSHDNHKCLRTLPPIFWGIILVENHCFGGCISFLAAAANDHRLSGSTQADALPVLVPPGLKRRCGCCWFLLELPAGHPFPDLLQLGGHLACGPVFPTLVVTVRSPGCPQVSSHLKVLN